MWMLKMYNIEMDVSYVKHRRPWSHAWLLREWNLEEHQSVGPSKVECADMYMSRKHDAPNFQYTAAKANQKHAWNMSTGYPFAYRPSRGQVTGCATKPGRSKSRVQSDPTHGHR
jgi:hypothetical protein